MSMIDHSSPPDPATPERLSPDLAHALAMAVNAVTDEGGVPTIDSRLAPSGDIRARFERRLTDVRGWLGRPSARDVAGEIGSVLVSMGSRPGSADDYETLIQIFTQDLADVPLFALRQACRDFRRGRVGDGRWAPTQAEILRVAERHLAPVLKHKADLERVLGAMPRPLGCNRKADIRALLEATRHELSHAPDPNLRGGMSAGELASAKRLAAGISAVMSEHTPS